MNTTADTTVTAGPIKVLMFHSDWANIQDRIVSAGAMIDESKDGVREDSDPMAANHGSYEVRTLTPSQRIVTLFNNGCEVGVDGAGAITMYRTSSGAAVASEVRYPPEYDCFLLPRADVEYLTAHRMASKRAPGRPAELTDGRDRTIYIDDARWQKAKALGNGKPSEGIRIALDHAK